MKEGFQQEKANEKQPQSMAKVKGMASNLLLKLLDKLRCYSAYLSVRERGSGKGRKSKTLPPKPNKPKALKTKSAERETERETEREYENEMNEIDISSHNSKKAKKHGNHGCLSRKELATATGT